MIDISLTKLLVIGLVALIVIGPERLPQVTRKLGALFGRTQDYINQFKEGADKEIQYLQLDRITDRVSNEVHYLEQKISSTSHPDATDEYLPGQGSSYTTSKMEATDIITCEKARNFKKTRFAHNTAIPAWYRRQNNCRGAVVQGRIRISKYRNFDRKQFPSFYR